MLLVPFFLGCTKALAITSLRKISPMVTQGKYPSAGNVETVLSENEMTKPP